MPYRNRSPDRQQKKGPTHKKMNEITLTIDGIQIKAKKGEKILWAALGEGIYIPNLCAIKEAKPPFGSCRLCLVEVEGLNAPVTACTKEVVEGMAVRTRSPKIDRLRRTALELLFSYHKIDCKDCFKKKECELLKIAKYLKVKFNSLRFQSINQSLPLDESNESLNSQES